MLTLKLCPRGEKARNYSEVPEGSESIREMQDASCQSSSSLLGKIPDALLRHQLVSEVIYFGYLGNITAI